MYLDKGKICSSIFVYFDSTGRTRRPYINSRTNIFFRCPYAQKTRKIIKEILFRFFKNVFLDDVFQCFPNFSVVSNARKLGLVLKCSYNLGLQLNTARFVKLSFNV